jgi:hypothetical protein
MRRHVPEAAVLTASLMIAAVAGPALATAATNAPAVTAAITTPAAGHAPEQAVMAAATTEPASRTVFLVTGEQVSTGTTSPAGVTVTTGGPGQATGSAGPLQTLRQGGTTQVMPVAAAPYLGRTLSPALFEPTALASAESAGRLPLRISYSAGLPALPGVTITSSGDGTATGYLTPAGARTFGAALARQYTADHTRASYGQDGIFHGVDISLAGTPAPAPVARPAYPMHTLIVKGTDLAGHPDNGDLIGVFNMDNATRYGGAVEDGYFYHGTARFSVPAGHYYAMATFCCGPGRSALHVVVVPQFTVGRTGTTTLHLSERSASSRMAFTTPRPAAVQDEEFTVYRRAARGGGFLQLWDVGRTGMSLWISPTTARTTTGTLQTETQATLTSPSSARGTPYAYGLDFPGPPGIVPAQHFSPSTASLATVHERYYQDAKSSGSSCTIGGYIFPDGTYILSCLFVPLRLPQAQTQYLSAGPSVVWQNTYSWPEGGQNDVLRTYRAGQQLTQDWGAYPLHPQPYAKALHGRIGARFPTLASAVRIGNTLTLRVTPFSDNVPGHTGTGYTGGRKAGVTGSYAIYQNGVRIAHGNPARQVSPVQVSGRPSVIRFTLTARRDRPLTRLSVASSTTWTWHTRRQPAATVPPAWLCGQTSSRRCAIQPMMTLDYHVAGLALNGTTTAGRQAIGLDAGHIQLGGQARITRVSARVSFTSGRSWQQATVTALGRGQFRITFTARAGAYVTLRTVATDAAGNSVTETIQRAYQIANGAAR